MATTISKYAQARPRNENGPFRSGGEKVYDWLLELESLRSWIDAYTAPMTRRNYLLGLNTLCKQLNPDQIIQLARQNGEEVPHDLKSRFKTITTATFRPVNWARPTRYRPPTFISERV